MRSRFVAGVASLAIVVTACGGGSSGGPQTEQGALDAVAKAQRGLLNGNSGDVLGFLSDECLDIVDEDEVKLGLVFIRGLLGEEVDLDSVEVVTTMEEFGGDTAEVLVEYQLPDGGDLDDLFFSSETIDVVYENGKWVADECDFGDDSEQAAEALADELGALGIAATRDDPAPSGLAVPVGQGYTVSIDGIDLDAYEAVSSAGGFVAEPDAGNQLVMIDVTIGYRGEEEPAGVGDVYFTGVGGTSAVGVDFYGCSGMDGALESYDLALLSGGVVSGAICGEVPADDVAGLLVNVGPSFSDNSIFFDPSVAASAPTAVTGSSGPDPDADLTAGRTAPIALGTATDVGEGWTLTVVGTNPDVDVVLGANEFNDPVPAGSAYVLVDLTLQYDGEDSGSATAVDLHLVGDSNVAARAGSCSVSWDGELERFSEVFTGGTLGGELCFLVPADDVSSLVLLATAAWGEAPEVFAIG